MEKNNLENLEQKTDTGRNNSLSTSILISSLVLAGALVYTTLSKSRPAAAPGNQNTIEETNALADLEKLVLPPTGVDLPIHWDDLGKKLVEKGIIDLKKLESLYSSRGGLTPEYRELLTASSQGTIKITPENSGFILNLFWAFGLANENEVLDQGPMIDSRYGGAGNFASTGGWTLANSDAMNHYSRHRLVELNPDQQALVERVAKNIYRPCCDNSTYFPDCNHGMAMLGLLELLAAQNISESEMYRFALLVNSYWFPDTYLNIAQYLKQKSISWQNMDPKILLGKNYSSASGYQRILNSLTTPLQKGSSCGA